MLIFFLQGFNLCVLFKSVVVITMLKGSLHNSNDTIPIDNLKKMCIHIVERQISVLATVSTIHFIPCIIQCSSQNLLLRYNESCSTGSNIFEDENMVIGEEPLIEAKSMKIVIKQAFLMQPNTEQRFFFFFFFSFNIIA